MTGDPTADPGRVLVLCTGNICRSPYVEHLLRDGLTATGTSVASAGTGAVVGAPMHEESLARLAERGIDGAAFRARQVTKELLEQADLVIGATREHVASVAWLLPTAMDRTHSLGDLARALRASRTAPSAGPDTSVAQAVARLAAEHRRRHGLDPRAAHTDVVDPYLQPRRTWEQMTRQVDEHLPAVVEALAGARW